MPLCKAPESCTLDLALPLPLSRSPTNSSFVPPLGQGIPIYEVHFLGALPVHQGSVHRPGAGTSATQDRQGAEPRWCGSLAVPLWPAEGARAQRRELVYSQAPTTRPPTLNNWRASANCMATHTLSGLLSCRLPAPTHNALSRPAPCPAVHSAGPPQRTPGSAFLGLVSNAAR